jgi:hypothetical protein
MNKFNVGDKVFHVGHGIGEVYKIDLTIYNDDVAMEVHFGNPYQRLGFTIDGRYSMIHKVPQLLTLEEARAKGYDVPKVKVKKKVTKWVNSLNGMMGFILYDSPELAKRHAHPIETQCKIECEVEE